jgi:hypothetical protein
MLPETCRVMTPGAAEPTAAVGACGAINRVGGQRNRSHPGRPWRRVLLSVARASFWNPGRTDV